MAIKLGAEKCGIASVARFSQAPEGFKPDDIYPKAKSVIVFLKSMPPEIIMSPNPIPYTGAAFQMYSEVDRIGLSLSRFLAKNKIGAIPIPCDTPYLHWDATISHGQGILSMRHAGYLAGLGYLGKNTLLINKDLGNMGYIGAVLADYNFLPDLIEKTRCPSKCYICIDACPQKALNGISVIQKLCRRESFVKTPRGFDLYKCSMCRKMCPRRLGY